MPSWVWDHCKKSENGQMATCLVCDSVLKTHGATTPLAQHLQSQHQIYCPPEKRRRNEDSGSNSHAGSSDVTADELVLGNETAETLLETPRPQPRSRRLGAPLEDATAFSHPCNRDRTEIINQALAQMIAINMLPASFADSLGFAKFMRVVEPGYKPPCAQTITRRLQALHDDIALKIKEALASLSAVAISADNWTSRNQDGYLTVQARFLDKGWKIVNVTLTTEEMSERHTAENLAVRFTHIFLEWGIESIISGIVTDNAANIVGAVLQLPNVAEKQELTCSVHTLQLCINAGLSLEEIKRVCSKASAIVTHFRHSNVATAALEKAQVQSKLKTLKLIQSCKTRWNSTFFMAERLVKNTIPVVSVLADRSVTKEATAIKLEMTGTEWGILTALVTALSPIQIACEILCADTSSVSMVQPILNMLVTRHLLPNTDDALAIVEFKNIVSNECSTRFNLDENTTFVSARRIASFLDPRYKDLMHETNIQAKLAIKSKVNRQLHLMEPTLANGSHQTATNSRTTAMDFIFGETSKTNDVTAQFQKYMSEPQIDRNLDPYGWWKNHEHMYPLIAKLARHYLCIPATSAASERTFSTAGNIVTAKRSCLAPENVNVFVFLHQNKFWYEPKPNETNK